MRCVGALVIPVEIYITNPHGVRFADGYVNQAISLDYGKREFEVGKLVITLPDTFPSYLFAQHNRVYVWEEGKLAGETFWLIAETEWQSDAQGGWIVKVTAIDLIALLTYRYAVDYSGDPRTIAIGTAADVVFRIVTEALGADALDGLIADNPARDISAYLDIGAPPPDTPLVFKTFAWQQILSTITAICQTSIEFGTYLTFDVVVQNNGKPQFRIYKNQRGIDRRGIITLSPEYENLTNVTYKTDWSKIATAVVAAGQGEEEDRATVYVVDQSRINLSPFGYIEYFRDARHIEDLTALENEALSRLNDGRPLIYATADLVERGDSLWGVHFGYGDQVTVAIRDALFDCRIRAYNVSYADGQKKVSVALEGQFRALRNQSIEDRFTYLAQNERPLPTP